MRKFNNNLDERRTRRQGFEERATSARDKLMDLRKVSGDLNRLEGARHWDLRNFCTDLNELGRAGGGFHKIGKGFD